MLISLHILLICPFVVRMQQKKVSLVWPVCSNSFPASCDFCHLLLTFANSLDQDQDQQNVSPDLNPNLNYLKKFILKKVNSRQQKHAKFSGMQSVRVHEIPNNVVCATSKASDQPAHTHSLIRAFANRLSII